MNKQEITKIVEDFSNQTKPVVTKHDPDDDVVAFTIRDELRGRTLGVSNSLNEIKRAYTQGCIVRPFTRREAKMMAALDLGEKYKKLTETDVTFEVDEDIFNDL